MYVKKKSKKVKKNLAEYYQTAKRLEKSGKNIFESCI